MRFIEIEEEYFIDNNRKESSNKCNLKVDMKII